MTPRRCPVAETVEIATALPGTRIPSGACVEVMEVFY